MGLLRNLRTVFELASRVNEIEQQWYDVQVNLTDKLDKLDRLMRRMTLRETRTNGAEQLDLSNQQPTAELSPKEQMRVLARQRGIIR